MVPPSRTVGKNIIVDYQIHQDRNCVSLLSDADTVNCSTLYFCATPMLSVPKRSTGKSFEGAVKMFNGLERFGEDLTAAVGAGAVV